jgi:hypothetical protein
MNTSSGLKTSDGVIYAGPCRLKGVQVGADGTNAATAILYDNASAASGTVVSKVIVDATLTHENHAMDIICNNGLYLDIGGTGAEVIVEFAPM